jgi:hypothetical protein
VRYVYRITQDGKPPEGDHGTQKRHALTVARLQAHVKGITTTIWRAPMRTGEWVKFDVIEGSKKEGS